MRKMALAACLTLLAVPALAAEKPGAPAENPMAAWRPPKVHDEAGAKKEILALMKAFEKAERSHDLEAATALVDFPVLMVTDDSKGQGMATSWDRDTWIKVMKPLYENPTPPTVKHKPDIFVMSDSLASLDDVATVTTKDGKTLVVRNNTLLLRKDGKWLVKAMTEGGWGNMMGSGSASGEPPTERTDPEVGGISPGGGSGPEK